MSIRVYVPCDSSAVAVGADEVAQTIADEAQRRGITIELIRNGSRGMCWLEPLVEVICDAGRVAYGPVDVDDVASLFEANFLAGGTHALALGVTEELPWMRQQERLCFARVGIIDPLSLDDYESHGGWNGLRAALQQTPEQLIATVTESRLRGRGGAAFPTGIKWNTVLGTSADQKYIVCNADEGDSGTYSYRMLMEGDRWARGRRHHRLHLLAQRISTRAACTDGCNRART